MSATNKPDFGVGYLVYEYDEVLEAIGSQNQTRSYQFMLPMLENEICFNKNYLYFYPLVQWNILRHVRLLIR
eukprot:UN14586